MAPRSDGSCHPRAADSSFDSNSAFRDLNSQFIPQSDFLIPNSGRGSLLIRTQPAAKELQDRALIRRQVGEVVQCRLGALTLDFLRWVDQQPRSYEEAMEAWRTGCPRLSIWEDAIADGLVVVGGTRGLTIEQVTITPCGRAFLDQASLGTP